MRRSAALLSSIFLLGFPPFGAPLNAGPSNAGVALSWFNTGCEIGHSVIHGCLGNAARGPIAAGEGALIGTRQGLACGWNILMLFAWGDMRITTAMEDGGITRVSSVDSAAMEILPGFYGINRYCTVVSGS